MNTDNGRIYAPEHVKAALERGEPVVPITQNFANYVQSHAATAKELAQALGNIKRAQPDMSLAEQEELAKKSLAVKR